MSELEGDSMRCVHRNPYYACDDCKLENLVSEAYRAGYADGLKHAIRSLAEVTKDFEKVDDRIKKKARLRKALTAS